MATPTTIPTAARTGAIETSQHDDSRVHGPG